MLTAALVQTGIVCTCDGQCADAQRMSKCSKRQTSMELIARATDLLLRSTVPLSDLQPGMQIYQLHQKISTKQSAHYMSASKPYFNDP